MRGEGYGPELVADLLQRVDEVWNFYGPTEASVWAVCTQLEDFAGAVPMGHPIAGMRCAVVDPRGHRSPVGIGGELWLAGEGLAHGYLGRADLTSERFVNDGLGDGSVWYRTGDVVRYRTDGTLVFVGRVDHQVKLRGFRVELGEIESALLAQDGVAEAVVVVREDRPGDPDLVAYLVGEAIDPSGVLESIRTSLPSYMIPTAVGVLDRLPLTPNGKLDRSALPRPDEVSRSGTVRAPRDQLEAELVALCSEVLDLDAIGTDEDLFDLGMTSIQAARLFTALEKRFPDATAAIGDVRGAVGLRTGGSGALFRYGGIPVRVDRPGPHPDVRRAPAVLRSTRWSRNSAPLRALGPKAGAGPSVLRTAGRRVVRPGDATAHRGGDGGALRVGDDDRVPRWALCHRGLLLRGPRGVGDGTTARGSWSRGVVRRHVQRAGRQLQRALRPRVRSRRTDP